eukprot:scaffold99916_cov27-Phaeocystis_antarctica.AAC.1
MTSCAGNIEVITPTREPCARVWVSGLGLGSGSGLGLRLGSGSGSGLGLRLGLGFRGRGRGRGRASVRVVHEDRDGAEHRDAQLDHL